MNTSVFAKVAQQFTKPTDLPTQSPAHWKKNNKRRDYFGCLTGYGTLDS